jgi:hypothetical protein
MVLQEVKDIEDLKFIWLWRRHSRQLGQSLALIEFLIPNFQLSSTDHVCSSIVHPFDLGTTVAPQSITNPLLPKLRSFTFSRPGGLQSPCSTPSPKLWLELLPK